MELCKKSFLDKMKAKAISKRLCLFHVIPEEVKTTIDQSTSDSEAAELLYDHLQAQATYHSLTTMIAIIGETQGYQQMSHFSEDLKASLESKN